MGTALYHGYVACPYRQGLTLTREGRERELMRMGMARRVSLLGVTVRYGACYVIT